MRVVDVMSKDVLTVSPNDSAFQVGSLMESKRIGAAVVVEGGVFRGVISKETFLFNLDRIMGRSIESVPVSELMEYDVDTVGVEDELSKAVEILLVQKGVVDRLPVLAGGRVAGIISKLDLTRVFSERMRGKYRVSDLMHYNPPTVFDYTPLVDVVKDIMDDCVRRVLVLSGEKLVGIITVHDISLAVFRDIKRNRVLGTTSQLTAEDLMTPNPVTVEKKKDAADAAKTMAERNIGGIPVVDGRLDGIITTTDLLKGYQLSKL